MGWKDYPIWAWVIFAIVFFSILNGESSYLFFGWIACLGVTEYFFKKQALKIKKSPTIPFLIVVFFAFLGYIIWYIYYRIKLKK